MVVLGVTGFCLHAHLHASNEISWTFPVRGPGAEHGEDIHAFPTPPIRPWPRQVTVAWRPVLGFLHLQPQLSPRHVQGSPRCLLADDPVMMGGPGRMTWDLGQRWLPAQGPSLHLRDTVPVPRWW